MSHGGGGAVGAVGWLPFRVVGSSGGFVRGRGGNLPCRARAVRAKNGSRASMVTAEKPGWLSLGGGGSPLLFVVGLLRCENGGIAAALLGAVAETAGIRSGGGRGLRKGKKGGVSLLSCWMIVEYILCTV